MAWDSKVLWTEGMFLQPHHFQQGDRHAEAMRAGLARALVPYGWGLTAMEIDPDALKSGRVALRSAAGLWPDGTAFRLPESDDHPPALEVPATIKDCVVLLTLPARRQGAAEVDMSGLDMSAARLRPAEIEVTDTMGAGRKSARLVVGQLRMQFGLAVDDLSDRLTIPIARVIEVRPDREVVLDRAFIPSVLDLRAAPVLEALVREIDGLLDHRMQALAGRLQASGSVRGAAELQDFLLLMAINRNLPVFRHLGNIENGHPVQLYRDCVALAGELSTFMAADKQVPQFPPYQHHDLNATFAPVIRMLRRYLSAVLEQNAVSIPLEARKYGISVGLIADRKLIGNAGFVLAVSADTPSENIRRHFADQAKLGPVEEIRQMVNSALPGIALRPLPVAPRQIPYHANMVYFEVAPDSPAWGRMPTSGGIAVHVAGDYPGLKMELWAIRHG
ncbi:type VI secretion system baseplate subunit TssK [Paracoccus sp. CPCC 101403]|uniref:Type VI secretion system baseplate subunit TssK n=1 Tax=Paracoccus broussonetiae TaxID=3075834 RepID=A0ABU3EDK3_9RHOB|nr:type VI secretion system baseplate subunit TssK [Paracoccus sp. CPCC 101403]MDT1062307.1 type VI secretion system baseplate subunit TssK [Paracoccus sp. CPCC 101403]